MYYCSGSNNRANGRALSEVREDKCVKDVPGDTGFIGNRIMGAARQEAQKIINEGIATAEDDNKVMMGGFNWPVGPVRTGGPSARTGWR